ncbi:hypothetical protein K504DRAFT_400504 [Pleomassaria siparia CBS 279.74]|uniref:Asteroid domain-containing protein n=1 Tax=Pleomassaria siparia CBS 279.74 TaxID=1314801 RepID=A0A6G1KHP0_9PLEO|nr:hypothetical protein K504DRAFT_400504 [Pleomassaria siparia CBS 279.74]
MGIAGLARRLEPYATHFTKDQLEGRSAIIDGPALAYDAHRVAAAAAASLSRVPTYADINAEAIRWLNALESVDIKVSAILFDGALPTSKQDERISRLQQNIKRVANFRANFPTTKCPIPTQLGSASYSFLAPSLMEALRNTPYAQVTRSVPGEADDWCASSANDTPHAIVFTSDTDLVLYKYPADGLVMFFKDANPWPKADIVAYSPTDICTRWKLKSLIPLAYSIIQGPWMSLSENVKDAGKVDLESEAYLDFDRRYTTTAQSPSYVPNLPEVHTVLQKLDVRVSEFVYQVLDTPFVPSVYLPFLLEDPNNASAWTFGEDIRLLAYSLIASNRVAVREYKRKAQSVNIQEHTLYLSEKVQTTVTEFSDNIRAWAQWTCSIVLPPRLKWPLFAASILLARLEQAPKLSLLLRVVDGDFDQTWEFVHLTARLHAVLYSLRLFKQCITLWLALNVGKAADGLCNVITELGHALEGLPDIEHLILMPGQSVQEARLDDDTFLRQALINIYAAANVEVPDEHLTKKQRKKERQARERIQKKSLQQAGVKKPTANANVFNVFDLLDRKSTT